MIAVDYICEKTNFSMCSFVSKFPCKNASRSFYFYDYKIIEPSTIALLIGSIYLTSKMIGQIKSLCSATGRKEMVLFYHLYLGSALIHTILLLFNPLFTKNSKLILTTLQMSFYSTAFFSLFGGCFTAETFLCTFGIRAITILQTLAFGYFLLITCINFTGLGLNSGILIFIPTFVLDNVFYVLYFLAQTKKLKKNNGEIWAYGTLIMGFLLYFLALILSAVDTSFIAYQTEKYFDSLFFYNLFTLCSFIMIHKYWLSVSDYEVEALMLEV